MPKLPASPNILITVEPPGAVWPHVDTLVRELTGLGVEVTVAALTPLRPGQRMEYAGIPGVELISCPFPVDNPQDHMAKRHRIADWLLGVEEMLNPDIVHMTGYLHAGLPFCGKVMVAGYPGSGSAYGRLDAEQRRLCRAAFHYGLAGADLVVTPTETMMNVLRQTFGVTLGRVIRDGRDAGRYVPGTKELMVLSMGTLRADPDRPSVLETAARGFAWPVVVAGNQTGVDRRALRLENVTNLGRVHTSQMVPWFNRAAIYAALAAEGPGTFVPEAALAGCALLLGETAALRELWSGAALFVAADDPQAVAAGMATLAGDHRLREAMGAAARRRALQYPASAMAESYLGIYRELMACRAPNQFVEEGNLSV